jgi:hypothetical protein
MPKDVAPWLLSLSMSIRRPCFTLIKLLPVVPVKLMLALLVSNVSPSAVTVPVTSIPVEVVVSLIFPELYK